MRNIYYQLIDYKEIHPIRFWLILMVLFVLLLLMAYTIKKILVRYKNISLEEHNTEIELKKQDGKNQPNFFNFVLVLLRHVFSTFCAEPKVGAGSLQHG